MAADPNPLNQPIGTVIDVPHAPFIYFEEAPNFGCNGGIINVSLAAYRPLLDGSGLRTDLLAVAHLRCNIPAALALKKALDDALLLGAPPAGGNKAN